MPTSPSPVISLQDVLYNHEFTNAVKAFKTHPSTSRLSAEIGESIVDLTRHILLTVVDILTGKDASNSPLVATYGPGATYLLRDVERRLDPTMRTRVDSIDWLDQATLDALVNAK